MIIPKHDFVWWELRVCAASNKRKDITSEKHLDDSNSTLEIYETFKNSNELTSRELVSVRTSVVDPEALLGTTGKASLVLVERVVKYLVRLLFLAARHLRLCLHLS